VPRKRSRASSAASSLFFSILCLVFSSSAFILAHSVISVRRTLRVLVGSLMSL